MIFPKPTSLSKKINIITIIGVYCIAFIVIFLHPLEPMPWQWADDALYFRTAQAIIQHWGSPHWLGRFQELYLSKAPFFPVFLVIINCIGIPLRFAEFILFAPLPFLAWIALRPLNLKSWFILHSSTICLVLIPIAGIESRLLRDTLFGAIAIYCLIFLCGYITRICLKKKSPWIWILGAGISLGLAVTTREEATWLIIPAAIALILPAAIHWHRIKILSIFLASSLLAVGYLLPVSTFSYLNYHSYGMFAPSIRQSSEFKKLYSTLCSVDPKRRQRYVPIGTATRMKVYKISPHFAKLRPFLEGIATDNLARNKRHLALNGFAPNSREFFVSNFEFALTDAIMLAGYRTGPEFIYFCNRTAKEIDDAAIMNKIEVGAKGISLLPPLEIQDSSKILSASFKSFWFLFNGQGQKRTILTINLPGNKNYPKYYDWHSFLKTWPYPSTGSLVISPSLKLKNYIFNFIVTVYRFAYPVFLIAGLISFFIAYFRKVVLKKTIFVMLAMGWFSFLSFSLTMGLVDTIAFPILHYPGSYNNMGFFPLHMLLFISIVAIYSLFTKDAKENK